MLTKLFFFISFISINIFAQGNLDITLLNYPSGEYKISYETLSEEKLKVQVLNTNNKPIENLSKEDFLIKAKENSTEIIKVVPLSELSMADYKIVLCLDNSSSMSTYKDELLAILDTLTGSLSKMAEIAVVFFDEKGYTGNYKFKNDPLLIQMKEFTGQLKDLKSFCKKYYFNYNMTNKTYLFDQIYVAFNSITKKNQQEVFYIIFSDGEDNASDTGIDDVLNSYKYGTIYSIDFSVGSQRNLSTNILKEIAIKSNGEYYKAEDAKELSEYFKKIAQKIIFSGYELTYKEYFPPEITQTGIFSLETNTYKNVNSINIEEIKSREFYPLLNYIFFDKNSSEISDRYSAIDKSNCNLFEEKNLPPDQLGVYHNILNILGKRLVLNQGIKIKLVGCNDNNDTEKNNISISKLRAESVKNYLINSWNITPDRITIEYQNLPQKPSNIRHMCGQEENRRVEIVCDDPNLFDPVEIETDTKIGEPGNLQFKLAAKFSSEPEFWKLFINQKENNLFQAEGKGYPPDYISCNINESIKNKTIDSSSLDIFINLKDKKGLVSKSYIMHLPVNYLSSFQKKIEKSGDKSIEKLSLVLFDFNSSALSKRNKDILLKVEKAITNCSRLDMIGYTDSIGTEQLNSKLSQQRASNALRELIKILKPTAKNLNSEGYGELVPLYDNRTPEGRFYNRTCQLIIETPLKVD